MATSTSAAKRQKERARQERQQAKEEKRRERRTQRSQHKDSPTDEDPDLIGIVPGPQPIAEEP